MKINRISRYYKPPDVRLARPEPRERRNTPTKRERSQMASARILEALCVGSVVLCGLLALAYLLGVAFRLGLGL